MAPRFTIRERPAHSTNQETYTVQLSRRYRVVTTVTSTPSVVRSWIYHTRRIHGFRLHKLVVGLGVQWRPGTRSNPRSLAATLQLCIGHRCLVFQLIHARSLPRALRNFLADPNITFVGVSNYLDAKYLSWDHGLLVHALFDLRSRAAEVYGRRDLRQASMGRLAHVILGIEGLDKDTVVGRSGWDAAVLNANQVFYACADAFVSFQLGRILRSWELKLR